jgi:hypothetical protein
MKKRGKLKKGDITIAQIVTFILLVLGFIILLIFYYNLDFKGNLGTEVCKESVLFRATAGQISGIAQTFIPLKCKTEKFCLTTKLFGNGNCKNEFGDTTGITTIRVNSLEQVEKFYAGEVFRCWSMMGEGKVSLFYDSTQGYGFGKTYPSCVICSRIAFDNSDFNLDLTTMNVHRYMASHKVPGKAYTYTQYLTSNTDIKNLATNVGGIDYNKLMEFADTLSENSIKTSESTFIIEQKPLENSNVKSENAVMFMQIVSPKYGASFKNAVLDIGLGMGVGYVLAPTLTTTATRAVIKSPLTWIALALAGVYQQGSVAYNRAITAGYCSDVMTGQDAREGCSVVRTINYDVKGISDYCQNIESIP